MDTFDPTLQTETLERQKAIIDAMQAQELQKRGRRSGLAGLAADYFGREEDAKQKADYAQAQQDYQTNYSKRLGQEADQYLTTSQGAPGQYELPEGQAGPQIPATPANPREAVIRAMTSRLPEMQAIGQAGMKNIGKPREMKEHVIGDTLIVSDGQGGARVVGSYNKADWKEETRTVDGKVMQGQRNEKTGEWKPLSAGGQTINIGEKQDAALLEPGMKILDKARSAILGEQKNLATAERIYQLSQDPQLISGPGATPLGYLSAIGAKLGLNGPEAAAKTQAMLTDLAGNALARGQEMKGSFSDADIKFLQDVTAGRIEASPEVMREVAALAYTTAHNAILENQKQYSGTAEASDQLRRAAGMYPMPAIKHKNLDPKLFTDEEGTGRMRYASPLRQQAPAGAAGGKKRMTSTEFLGG